jgi:heme/copper-type cytochrome/quinol oxidase subunit 2
MQKTGEIMLIVSLIIIFIVILSMTVHLFIRHRYRRSPRKEPKKDLESTVSSELHSTDKKVFEAAGTEVVLCELPPEAPPLIELDAGDVHVITPIQRAYTGTTRSTEWEFDFGFDAVSPEDVLPRDRQMAQYWSARL